MSALKYFRETVKRTSIRKAAEALNVAPSAVNRQILKLEEQIETKLFERVADGVRLTSAGEVFYRYALKAEHDLDRAVSEIDDLRRVRRGHVSIACEEGFAKDLLPDVIRSFHVRSPGVSFGVRVADMPSIVRQVIEGEVDIGIAFDPSPNDDLTRKAEIMVAVGAAMTPDHPFSGKPSLRLSDLVGEPIILQDSGFSIRHRLDRQAKSTGLRLGRIAETNSFEAMTALIKAGIGIGIRSRIGIESEIARGEIVFVPIVERNFQTDPIAICTKTGRLLPVAAALFAERLTAAFATIGDTGAAAKSPAEAPARPQSPVRVKLSATP
jgi:DNA-binding transcriptional LysR family regulator